jgi:hypothetical protein
VEGYGRLVRGVGVCGGVWEAGNVVGVVVVGVGDGVR